jgi:hypothetical protein
MSIFFGNCRVANRSFLEASTAEWKIFRNHQLVIRSFLKILSRWVAFFPEFSSTDPIFFEIFGCQVDVIGKSSGPWPDFFLKKWRVSQTFPGECDDYLRVGFFCGRTVPIFSENLQQLIRRFSRIFSS